MNALLTKITQWAENIPNKIAVIGSDYQMSYQALNYAIKTTAAQLTTQCQGVIGLLIDNSPAWVVIDLACQLNQTTLVPIAPFYTKMQCQSVLKDANVQWLLTDNLSKFSHYPQHFFLDIAGSSIMAVCLTTEHKQLPFLGLSKITYTSGTTGDPKGVCLSEKALLAVTHSLAERVQSTTNEVHLSLTPLAVLLENIASVYVCLLSGGTSCVPSLIETGLKGSSSIDINRLLSALKHYQPSSVIMMPSMLEAIVTACEQGKTIPKSLRFLSVGGAVVKKSLLQRAESCDIPVYQGYGLSECASVVALNTANANKIGSVGKILPHLKVRLSPSSEIEIKGSIFNGYLHQNFQDNEQFFPTGDLGFIDDDDFLYILDRKKNQFITAFGRNVSAEWVENELTASDAIHHAFVYGEAKLWNTAVVFSAIKERKLLADYIEQTNQKLPDYAQIKTWINAGDENTFQLSREQVFEVYKSQLESFYTKGNC
jgi:long-subunit acyl-CoA synthetase (AMP-forming)